MAYKVRTNESADRDTEKIIAYLVETLHTSGAASHFKSSLRDCHDRLGEHPLMYPLCRDEALAARGFRLAPVMRYIAFYTVDERKKIVRIHRILHGAMDYTEQNLEERSNY